MTKKAVLYRMVTDEHICPFGIKSKDLLQREGYEIDDRHFKTKDEAEAFKEKHNVKTTPQTFINGERIGGFDDLEIHFGKRQTKEKDATSYTPVLSVFAITLLIALVVAWRSEQALLSWDVFKDFIALSMTVLALLKLRDLDAFTNQFITYDILGRRVVRYAYFYPFAEAFAGLGMLAGILTPIVASTALFIGTIGAISVIKAVYIDKRDLKCACVGGNSNVPLGAISLTENLMMIFMGTWMLF